MYSLNIIPRLRSPCACERPVAGRLVRCILSGFLFLPKARQLKYLNGSPESTSGHQLIPDVEKLRVYTERRFIHITKSKNADDQHR